MFISQSEISKKDLQKLVLPSYSHFGHEDVITVKRITPMLQGQSIHVMTHFCRICKEFIMCPSKSKTLFISAVEGIVWGQSVQFKAYLDIQQRKTIFVNVNICRHMTFSPSHPWAVGQTCLNHQHINTSTHHHNQHTDTQPTIAATHQLTYQHNAINTAIDTSTVKSHL